MYNLKDEIFIDVIKQIENKINIMKNSLAL